MKGNSNYSYNIIPIILFIVLILIMAYAPYGYAQASCKSLSNKQETASRIFISKPNKSEIENGFENLIGASKYYSLRGIAYHSIQFKRSNDWGVHKNISGRALDISIPVRDIVQAESLVRSLMESLSVDTSAITYENIHKQNLPANIKIYISLPKEKAGQIEPSVAVSITTRKSDTINSNKLVINALRDHGLAQRLADQIRFDMTNNTGRHEWALKSFDHNRNLTIEEVRALQDLSGPDYKKINKSLRDKTSILDARVQHIDSAINKGTVDKPIKSYRTVIRSDLLEQWHNIMEGKPVNKIVKSDPAYLYTSLDPKVARWWQEYNNKQGEWLILEIDIPKGSKAAYIDSRVIERRGYLELVLPRNSTFEIVSAREESGDKILSLKMEIN